jgi:CheY-like chemotaxis protein
MESSRRLVLVIDDDKDIREAVASILEDRGHDVVTAVDGRDALERLATASPLPDAIIFDLVMPVMNGWEFRIEQLRDAALADIPAIAISSSNTPTAAAVDADAYLHKPFAAEDLLFAVEKVLQRVERERLRAMRAAQVNQLSTLGMVASSLAHEINNPLATIVVASEGAPDDDPAVRAAMTEIRGAVQRITVLIKNLAVFASAESQAVRPIDIAALTRHAVTLTKSYLRHRGRIEMTVGELPPVAANESRILQAIVNLVLTAAEWLPVDGGSDHAIRVTASVCTNDDVLVAVSATGPAVVARQQRGAAGSPGFALGLAIARDAVVEVGGRIEVVHEQARGVTLRMILPPARGASDRELPAVARAAVRRARILMVDDEPTLARAYSRALASDHDVTATTSASEAIAWIADGRRFDLIITDVMMPVVTGIELHERIAAIAPAQAARIVFLTGSTFDPHLRGYLATHANRVLLKPIGLDALRHAIADALAITARDGT